MKCDSSCRCRCGSAILKIVKYMMLLFIVVFILMVIVYWLVNAGPGVSTPAP